jgi:hypothetical protein
MLLIFRADAHMLVERWLLSYHYVDALKGALSSCFVSNCPIALVRFHRD